MVLTIVTRAKL